jgi:hypothetical protein
MERPWEMLDVNSYCASSELMVDEDQMGSQRIRAPTSGWRIAIYSSLQAWRQKMSPTSQLCIDSIVQSVHATMAVENRE